MHYSLTLFSFVGFVSCLCYVETDYMIAGPPMSFGMMKGNMIMSFLSFYIQNFVLTRSSCLDLRTLWG